MEQCNCCRCNRDCVKPVENRCSCNQEMKPCQQAKQCQQARPYQEVKQYQEVTPMRECYMPKSRCANEVYECPETANDEVGCMPIAMAYVPWQQWGDVFTGECGLEHGTIFPELVKPWWICCGQR